jgi:hypothetical protein
MHPRAGINDGTSELEFVDTKRSSALTCARFCTASASPPGGGSAAPSVSPAASWLPPRTRLQLRDRTFGGPDPPRDPVTLAILWPVSLSRKPLISLVPQEGFEPPTPSLRIMRKCLYILLNLQDKFLVLRLVRHSLGIEVVPPKGFEPSTPALRIMQPKSSKALISLDFQRVSGAPWHRGGTEQEKWCRRADSNRRPMHYECIALPAELLRRRAPYRGSRDRGQAAELPLRPQLRQRGVGQGCLSLAPTASIESTP